ncbi:MAG: hypothetical protein ACREV1_11205 [Gammaproteobacteria bacterium]
MKTKHLKAAGAAVSLLIASGPALATSTGPQTLGAFAEATDVFQFTCPARTVMVRWNVSDTTVIVNVPARIRMGMTKVGQIHFFQREDNLPGPSGEGGSFSTSGALAGGAGTYQAIIYKTDAGADSYEGHISCTRDDGVAITPVLPAVPQQNQ